MSWIPIRWLAGAALVLVAVGALFVAGAAEDTAPYVGALVAFGFCTLGVFALISSAWGRSPLARLNPLPANGAARWVAGAVGVALALLGLFDAQAAEAGGLAYYQGLALFAAAVGYDFLLLKDWFDRGDAAAG